MACPAQRAISRPFSPDATPRDAALSRGVALLTLPLPLFAMTTGGLSKVGMPGAAPRTVGELVTFGPGPLRWSSWPRTSWRGVAPPTLLASRGVAAATLDAEIE